VLDAIYGPWVYTGPFGTGAMTGDYLKAVEATLNAMRRLARERGVPHEYRRAASRLWLGSC